MSTPHKHGAFFYSLDFSGKCTIIYLCERVAGEIIASVEIIPVSLLSIINYHRVMARGHRFTAYKEKFFIGNEFGGRV